eukprot:Colp12_sorted_trinity150504_noHs@16566
MSTYSDGGGTQTPALSPAASEELTTTLLDHPVSKQKNTKVPAFVYILTLFSAVGGFLFGYDTGVISGAMLLIKKQYNLNSTEQELVVSTTVGGAILGAAFGGRANDKYGRRPVILISAVVFLAGAIVMTAANGYEMLVVGRSVVGLGIGLASMSVPVFIAECSPPELRGGMLVLNNMFITGGQAIAGIIDGAFSDVPEGWRYMLGLSGVPAVILLVGFLFMPESPRWLLHHGQVERGRKVLVRLRGHGQKNEIEEEISSIMRDSQGEEQASFWEMIKESGATRKALIVGCGLQALQQLSGINTVMYYSATIIKLAGFTSDTQAIWLAAAIAGVNFLFTIVGLYIIERAGRRKLVLGSLLGVILSLGILGLSFQLGAMEETHGVAGDGVCGSYTGCGACVKNSQCGFCDPIPGASYGMCLPGNSTDGPSSGQCSSSEWKYDYCYNPYWWLSITSLVTYIAFFAPGMGPIPWTVNSEIYKNKYRSMGNSVSTSVNWIGNLIISFTFLHLTDLLTPAGAFWLYGGIGILGFFFIYALLPETKGKSLEEIQYLFE